MKLKHRSILSLHVELEQWDDAFALESLHPELQGTVSLPYAEWLVQNDRFEEARVSYKQAERPDLSEALLKKLIDNAVRICSPFTVFVFDYRNLQ